MIIIISGTSSSGKSSVCLELQNRLGNSWLNFSTDGYLGMLGNKLFDLHPENTKVTEPNDICYARQHADGTYEIMPGKWCSKLFATIPQALEVLAAQDFNIIVDSFITTKEDLKHYQAVLRNFGLFFVYLYAPDRVITKREEARGDRLKGSAIHWLKQFDYQDDCDLLINTETISIGEICDAILKKIPL
ncbi:phosphotransferase-like protein [Legionella cardiaca]|uniref:AAA family ATPase n=1 Tax=Legionella cardiaca TaxID=1071983 RepID=A0ABY8AQ25_9GAMM|nr:AAA family ATPase [Legionella cardiaca]WED42539.1 AAA family ATPase [Legionella cardiaca]